MRTLDKADTCEMWTLEVGTDRFYSLNTLNNADTCHLRTRTAFFGTEDALNLRKTDTARSLFSCSRLPIDLSSAKI